MKTSQMSTFLSMILILMRMTYHNKREITYWNISNQAIRHSLMMTRISRF